MNYYELIYLIKDLNIKFNDATLDRIISPQKNILECYIGDGCLRFHAVPPSPYLYIRSWQSGKKKNVVEFFPEVYGKRLKKLALQSMIVIWAYNLMTIIGYGLKYSVPKQMHICGMMMHL